MSITLYLAKRQMASALQMVIPQALNVEAICSKHKAKHKGQYI